MKTYARIAGEGAALLLAPIFWILFGTALVLIAPLFLVGILKRGIVLAFTSGDPLVP